MLLVIGSVAMSRKTVTNAQFKILQGMADGAKLTYESTGGEEDGFYLGNNRKNASVVEHLLSAGLIELGTMQHDITYYDITQKGRDALKIMEYQA